MPRFDFSLQALLDQRLHDERAKQLAVATVERERAGLEADIAQRQRTIAGIKEDVRALLSAGAPGGVDVRSVRLQAAASLHSQALTQRLSLRLAGVYQRLEAARVELRAASTRRRAVELLRQRRYDEWRRAIDRRERAELDEIGTMRAARIARSTSDD